MYTYVRTFVVHDHLSARYIYIEWSCKGLQVSGNADSDREAVYDIYTVVFIVAHMRRSGSIPRLEASSSTREPELNDVIKFLNSGYPNVVANAASYLQNLADGDDNMKSRIR